MSVLDLSKAKYSFSVGGTDFAIIDLSMGLTLNAPPQLQIKAVPKAFIDSKVVNTAGGELFWKFVSVADRAIGRPNVDLSISSLGPDAEFGFNAKGWVLSDVGLSASASAETPATIDFCVQHPIVLLSKYPSSLGPTTSEPDLSGISGSYLEVVKGVLKAYSEKLPDSTKKQPTYGLFEEGLDEIDKYVACEGCDVSSLSKLFPWVDSTSLEYGFKRYILSCATSGTGASLYSFLTQAIASELSLGVFMNPNDLSSERLILKPRVPFLQSGCAGIDPEAVINISNSHGDWLAPSGIYANMYKLRLPNFNHPDKNGQSMPDPVFVSVIAKDGGTQIVPISIPGWINTMLGNAYLRLEWNNDNGITNPQSLDFSREDHIAAVRKIMTQYFLDMYKQSKNIVINKLFSIFDDTDGHKLIPGISCSISGKVGDGLLFLITSIQHQFSLANNQALTSISGNYVRGSQFSVEVEGADPRNLIVDGFSEDVNYIWG